ncbi:hypothetical protein SASPL_114520 [Salvia splendens]|uniref:Uncharacterized protein n=1 Tax=Salvia splendens TaxID=180675 RepID=A0A8X9A0S7_SALSN|nr:hypothetical protein SASPL_114520 [Salvia splendens]
MMSRTESIVVTCGNGASMLEPFPSSPSALDTPAMAFEHILASLARLEARMDALERRASIAQPPPWPDPDPPYTDWNLARGNSAGERPMMTAATAVTQQPLLGDHLESAAKIVNSIDVLIYINDLFLWSLVIQIIPLGMRNIARGMFGANPEEMKLKYLEYIITPNESSLLGKVPNSSLIYTFPKQYCENIGTRACQRQDVKLDLARFQDTLLKALDIMAA